MRPTPIPILLLPIRIVPAGCVGIKEPFEKSAQDAVLRMHLMSNGIINALLGAMLYFWLTRREFSYTATNALVSMSASLGCFLVVGVFLNHVIAEQPLPIHSQWTYAKNYLHGTFFYKRCWTNAQAKSFPRRIVGTICNAWKKALDKLNDMRIKYAIGSKFNGYFILLKTPLINHLQYPQIRLRLERLFACGLIDDT